MEILNIIIAAITAATFNSVAHSAPVHNTPSTLELLVTAVIPSRVTTCGAYVSCQPVFLGYSSRISCRHSVEDRVRSGSLER